jgi:hypothetical protein
VVAVVQERLELQAYLRLAVQAVRELQVLLADQLLHIVVAVAVVALAQLPQGLVALVAVVLEALALAWEQPQQ